VEGVVGRQDAAVEVLHPHTARVQDDTLIMFAGRKEKTRSIKVKEYKSAKVKASGLKA